MFPLCMTVWDEMGRYICSLDDQVSIKISYLHSQLPNQDLHVSVLLHLRRAFGNFSLSQYASVLFLDQRWKKHMYLLLWFFLSASWVPKPKPTSYWRSCTAYHVSLSTWNPYWVNGAEVHFSLVTQLCLTLCNPMDCSTPGFPVHHQLLELAIQPSHPLSSPSPTFNLSQHQELFHWVSSLHQVAKVLEFQLQHQSFQWIFRTDFF